MPDLFHHLEKFAKYISMVLAFVVCVVGCIELGFLVKDLFSVDTKNALEHGLFIIFLLELFIVLKSYVQRGKVNIALVINVCIIASMKEILAELPTITLQKAMSFTLIFLSLGVLYLVESHHFLKKKAQSGK